MLRRALMRLALALAIASALPAAARAHAVVRATEPTNGAVLEAAPQTLSVRFSEAVLPVSVRLVGISGDMVDPLTAASSGDTVTLPAPPDLPDGGYLLAWRVTSLDGHPIVGSISFTLGAAGSPVPPAMPADDPWPLTIARFVQYGALLLAVGGALFLVAGIGPPSLGRRIGAAVRLAAGIGAVATVAIVGLEGLALLGTPFSTLLIARPWVLGAETSAGTSAAAVLAGLLAIALACGRHLRPAGRAAAFAGALAAAAGLALTGHAGTADPRWLTGPALAFHVLAAAFWVGSLLPLLAVLARGTAGEAAAALTRFSLLATGAVAVLILCGATLALVQVPDIAGLLATDYGVRLLLKLALVLAMLALAAVNRWRLLPRLVRGDEGFRRPLGRSIGLEALLAAGVVATTAALGAVPPPRTAEPAVAIEPCSSDAGTRLVLQGGGIAGGLTVLPACTGSNQVYVALTDEAGAPLAADGAALRLVPPAGAALVVALSPSGPGRFRGTAETLALPGAWTAELTIQRDAERRVTLLADLPIGQK